MESRTHGRAPLDLRVTFIVLEADEAHEGRARDISIGGMFVECTRPAPFGAELMVIAHVVLTREPLRLPARVRWGRPGGMGLQFGLLGARETYAITELVWLSRLAADEA